MFFTSDTHFNHAAILGLCGRPFADIAAMDRALVDNWNAVVRPVDDVWHLGDFAHRGDDRAIERIFKRLHGRKRLIVGNHDGKATLSLPWMEPPIHMRTIGAGRQRIVLCHCGLRTWPGYHRGALHLYGHSHGRLPGNSRSLDVGVEAWDYRPASLDEVLARLATLPVLPDSETRELATREGGRS